MGFGVLQIKTQTATVNTLSPLIKTPPLDMTGGREQSEQGNVWVDGRRGGGLGNVCVLVCVCVCHLTSLMLVTQMQVRARQHHLALG